MRKRHKEDRNRTKEAVAAMVFGSCFAIAVAILGYAVCRMAYDYVVRGPLFP